MENSYLRFYAWVKNKSIFRFVISLIILIFFSLFESFGQATYTWNQTGTADWTEPANWTPNRSAPATTDILQFNTGVVTTPINIPNETIGQLNVTGNTTINLQGSAINITLTISGLTGSDDLVVANGSALNINVATNNTTIFLEAGATALITGNMTFSAAAHRFNAIDAGAIVFNSPAVLTQDAGCTGNIFTNSGIASAIVFNMGSTFVSIDGGNPFGLTQPNSKVVFNTGSLYKHKQSLFPSFSGRNYADFELDFASANLPVTGGTATNINNLIITAGQLNLNLTGGVNIKGNISVAAGQTLTFNPPPAGTLTFNGTTPQTITNNGTLTFGANEDVVFNNASGITLNSDITLNKLVTFTNGIIKIIPTKILTLSSSASVAGVSNTSFVDGPVRKIGNTAFIFPIGKSIATFTGYVPIEISATTGALTDFFTAEYKRSTAEIYPVSNAGINHVSRADYWILDRAGTIAPVNVTYYWTTESSSGGSPNYINVLSELVIANSDGFNWVNFGGLGTYGASTTTAGSLVWTGLTNSFGPFSLASTTINNPLPIYLNYLNGYKLNNHNYLTWKVTCTNNPNATMKLERCADGKKFKEINSITADALRCQQPFDYIDTDPLTGMIYYRLKMIDAFGKVTYSSTIALLNKESGFDIVGLLPNLVNSNAVLNVTASQKTKMDVVVTDIAGKQVQKISFNLIAGSNQFNLNFSNLSAGTYQITGYTVFGKSRTVRFVKQ